METERIVLRELEMKDVKDLAEEGNEEMISLFTMYMPFPYGILEARNMVEEDFLERKKNPRKIYRFGVWLKEKKRIIGIVDVYDLHKKEGEGKVGYWIGKKWRGKGLASEALQRIIKFAFEDLNLDKIITKTLVTNDKSIALLEKFNFKKAGVFKGHLDIGGKQTDCLSWELERDTFDDF